MSPTRNPDPIRPAAMLRPVSDPTTRAAAGPTTRPRRRALLWSGLAATILVAGAAGGFVRGGEGLVDASGPSSADVVSDRGVGSGAGRSAATAGVVAGDVAATTTTIDGSGAAATAAPSDVDESPRPGAAGVITGHGAASPTIGSTIPAPVELAVVEPFAPPAAPPESSEVDLLAAPAPGPIGDLTTGLEGCAAQCLRSAVVTTAPFTSSLELRVETNVRARLQLFVSTSAPAYIGGVPTFLGGEPYVERKFASFDWSTTVAGLDGDTTYHLILVATDLDGRSQAVTAPVRTTGQFDQLVAPGGGCTHQCISAGVATPTERFDVVDLHVETSTPAELSVSVSPQEPGWIGGSPILPADIPVSVPAGLGTSWDLRAAALSPETTYHVVVRATDAEGRYSSRVGSFTTMAEPPATVQTTIEQVTVTYDGDAADVNRGEIELAWNIGDQQFGGRSEEKMHDGTVVAIGAHNSSTFLVDRDGVVPPTVVNVRERDADGHSNEGAECANSGVRSTSWYDAPCDTRTSVALTGLEPVEKLEGLPSCAVYGMIGEKEDDRCAILVSPDLGDEYARFWVLVSYRIS